MRRASLSEGVHPQPEPLLQVSQLTHRFGERVALDDVSFSLAAGEVLGLLGPNGSGKSTALSVLSGLLPLQSGSLRWKGEPLAAPTRAYRSSLGVVFQSASLDLKLGALQNLELAAALHGLPRKEGALRAKALLEAAGLAGRARDRVSTLSGGMRRRLDLARVMIPGPTLLLLDEPTVGLDEAAFRDTWRHLATLRDEGAALLVATHRAEEAERCDRLAVLVRGRLVALESPASLRDRVRADVIVLAGPDPGSLANEIQAKLGLEGLVDGREVIVDCERGHELVPRLVESLPPGRLDSVSLRRPTLADAFLKVTGEALDADRDEPDAQRGSRDVKRAS